MLKSRPQLAAESPTPVDTPADPFAGTAHGKPLEARDDGRCFVSECRVIDGPKAEPATVMVRTWKEAEPPKRQPRTGRYYNDGHMISDQRAPGRVAMVQTRRDDPPPAPVYVDVRRVGSPGLTPITAHAE